VQLRAFRAYFQPGHPVYSARQVRVSVGCRSVGWNADGWSPDPSPAALHSGETQWLWTSRVMDMQQASSAPPTLLGETVHLRVRRLRRVAMRTYVSH
jgi:hypothetical protein